MTAIGFAGKAGWASIRKPSDVELGGLVRVFVWQLAGRTVTAGASRDRQVVAAVRGRFPTAVDTFGQAAILALTRHPGPGTCSWCAAAVIAAATLEPLPDPASPALQALLGRPCRRCVARQRTAEVAQRERAHLGQLTASGLTPAAAARLRTREQVDAQVAAIRRLEHARPRNGPAPTGMLWSAGGGQPAEVTAALQAAGRRRARRSR